MRTEEQKERVKAAKRRWKKANREKVNSYERKYRENNRDKVKAHAKKYRQDNLEKFKALAKKHREKNREKLRSKRYRERYGISVAGYNKLLADQNGRCAICGTTSPGGVGTFHVDHDHSSDRIRGLLCFSCNTAIGKFNDDPSLLRLAADYLERSMGSSCAAVG